MVKLIIRFLFARIIRGLSEALAQLALRWAIRNVPDPYLAGADELLRSEMQRRGERTAAAVNVQPLTAIPQAQASEAKPSEK